MNRGDENDVDREGRATGAAGLRAALLWSSLAGAVAAGARLLALLALARLLPPAEFGRVAWALWTAELLALWATAGWSQAVTRYTAELEAEDEPEVARALARDLARGSVWGALVAGAIWVVWLLTRETVTLALALVAWVYFAAAGAGMFAPAWLQGRRAFAQQAGLSALGGWLALAGGVVGGALAGAAGALAGLALGVTPAVWLVVRDLGPSAPDVAPALRRRARRFAWVTAGAAALSAVVWNRAELLLLEAWAEPVVVGHYAAALLYASLVGQVALLGRSALLPHFTSQREPADRRASYERTTALLGWLLIPAGVVGAVVAPTAVAVLWGQAYAPAWPLFAALSLGGLVQVLAAGGALASSLERNRFVLGMAAVGAVAFGLVGIGLIPIWGAWGAVAARLVGQWTMGLGGAVYLARVVGVGLPWRPWSAAALATVPAAALAWWLGSQWPNAAGLAAALAAAGAVVASLAWGVHRIGWTQREAV